MNFSWRRRRAGVAAKLESSKSTNSDMELTISTHFRCPISLDLMKDPITLSTGITYDRENIEKWFDAGNVTCPVTNQILRNLDQVPNHSLRKMIQDWCVENKSYGVERIPTPRIPITPYEVSHIGSRMVAATKNRDVKKCLELVGKIKNLGKESERNKRCIVSNGFGSILADSFDAFSRFSIDENVNLLKEILSTLTWTFPIDQEAISKLKSAISLRCIAWFLKGNGDLSSKQNAIFVLKQLISSDPDSVNRLTEIEGIEETLFQILKIPICPKATKACLMIIDHMMLEEQDKINGTITLRFVQMGLIPLILEILVDGDKSTCEKALVVFESICNLKEGRKSARENALTIPLLVKKILRVSNIATELSISTLWKLCLEENDENLALFEAVQLGAFQKILVVLQVGCDDKTKEKVTELLKLMKKLYRDKLEDCFDRLIIY
ncbi:hypothetical protein ACJIZ3_002492 [Penstemon smallii]|uniref:U-box domain-containing protein n=1 Tax=Penstemon smallii TaxID=265156 RepID=A0ABD3U6K9_9LAMI